MAERAAPLPICISRHPSSSACDHWSSSSKGWWCSTLTHGMKGAPLSHQMLSFVSPAARSSALRSKRLSERTLARVSEQSLKCLPRSPAQPG